VVDDAAAALRDYASQGYDLVIAHGSQYGSSLQEIAPTSLKPVLPGVQPSTPSSIKASATCSLTKLVLNKAGIVNGVIAASMSESNVLGVVGPIETGDAKLYVDGFVAGAKATKPDITVNVNYIGSFSDVALASEAAQTHIKAGCRCHDRLRSDGGRCDWRRRENNVWWFGTQSSQTSLAPSIVVASQVYEWTVVLKRS